jgi:pilus assembly protein Flp/PilA
MQYNVFVMDEQYRHPNLCQEGGETSMLFLPREKGQGLVEYALILVLVAIVVIAILLLLGPIIGNIFSNIVNAI